MSRKIISELRANLGYLSSVERRIAEQILDDPKRFITFSMSELSELADVSQGSIINFANKFSNGGYSNLKLQIAAGLSEIEPQPFSVVSSSDTVMNVLDKTTVNTAAALNSVADLNEEETLKTVADKILKAKKVEIYGVFRSGIVATDFYYQLLQLGIHVSAVSGVLNCARSAAMLGKEALVIAVSSSGKTKDIIDAVSTAKSKGVSVVCITGNRNSPLAKMSDYVLVAPSSGRSISGNACEVRFSQLLIADTICSYLSSKIDEDSEKRYWDLRSVLESHNVED